MTIEEMKTELEKEGYSIVRKGVEAKEIERRDPLYWKISDYFRTHKSKHYKETGELYPDGIIQWTGSATNIEVYARQAGRKMMKRVYGYKRFDEVPDSEWPKIENEVYIEAKKYIDRKIRKLGWNK